MNEVLLFSSNLFIFLVFNAVMCGDFMDIHPKNVYYNKVKATDEWSELRYPFKDASTTCLSSTETCYNIPLNCILDIYSTTGAVELNIQDPVKDGLLQVFGSPSSDTSNSPYSSPIASVSGSDILGSLTTSSETFGLYLTLTYIRTPKRGFLSSANRFLGWFRQVKKPGTEIIIYTLYS